MKYAFLLRLRVPLLLVFRVFDLRNDQPNLVFLLTDDRAFFDGVLWKF